MILIFGNFLHGYGDFRDTVQSRYTRLCYNHNPQISVTSKTMIYHSFILHVHPGSAGGSALRMIKQSLF